MLSFVNTLRLMAALMVVVILQSGCSWFQARPEFEGVETSKPLVIPAGLDKPSNQQALMIPSKSLIGANAKSKDVISGFLVNYSVDNVYNRLGTLLPTVELVTVLNKVESLKSYEVRYGPDVFLISVQANGTQTQVAALGADGAVLNNQSASQLLKQLKILLK
jgi:uncharacterized lipoprotein